jgi:UDP-N-acetylmuramate-alanine ligase
MPSFGDARRLLGSTLRKGDVCLVMGAGDVDRLARDLVRQA